MKSIFSILAMFLLGTSCNDPEVNERGDLFGSVILYNEGTERIEEMEGMSIALENPFQNTQADDFITFTDEEGKFRFENVEAALYNLTFEKENFGKHAIENFIHKGQKLGTPLDPIPSLGQKSTTSILSLEALVQQDNVFLIAGTDQAASISNPKYLRFFFSTSEEVSETQYLQATDTYVARIDPFELTLPKSKLLELGYSSGQRVYARCYGDSFWSNSYTDKESGIKIYSNLNPQSAEAVSFFVP